MLAIARLARTLAKRLGILASFRAKNAIGPRLTASDQSIPKLGGFMTRHDFLTQVMKEQEAMSEEKRRSYAVDDVDTISKRLKEIEAERAAAIADTELPSDDCTGFKIIDRGTTTFDECWQQYLD